MTDMMKKLTLLDDPRYPEFVARYAGDALRFTVEVCGIDPTADQRDLLMAISLRGALVSVAGGYGSGKTFICGPIVLWCLLARPWGDDDKRMDVGSSTKVIGADAWLAVRQAADAIASNAFAWLMDYLLVKKTVIEVRGFSSRWSVNLEDLNVMRLAGMIRRRSLVVVDDAAAIKNSVFYVILSSQAGGDNKILLCGTSRPDMSIIGAFRRTHHELSRKNGGRWIPLNFSSEKSPFVSDVWLTARAEDMGGRESNKYRACVLGEVL